MILIFTSVFAGGNAKTLFKEMGEIGRILKAAHLGYLGHIEVGHQKQLLGVGQPYGNNIFGGGNISLFFENL